MSLIRDRLTGLAVLAVLAIVPSIVCAQHSRASDTARAADSLLSQTQLKKVNDFLAAKGKNQTLNASVVRILGLPRDVADKHGIRQLAVRDKRTDDVHTYSQLTDGGLELSYVDATTAYNYRLDSEFSVVGSISMTEGVPSTIKNPERGARAELAYWAHVADQLP